LAHDLWELVWAEEQESKHRDDQDVGNREHRPAVRHQHPGSPPEGDPSAVVQAARSAVKIIYTRGNRTETLASLATLRKILNRFVAHRVFYEVSSRSKRGHEFYSAKNIFVVGLVEVTNYEHLKILIFDANNQAHSIEILNPQTMRIYDEAPGRGFAVSFISEGEGGVETRCYIRDEGEDGDHLKEQTALEKITLPQLFEYLEEITAVEATTR
jgi:hypothetical protein